ncbi:MAG: methionyl-tRNA formyltransferase, partial [Patescibacteria group bacterium]
MDKSNFAFFGTPEVASETLEILFGAGYIPKVIVTSPDRRSGRGMHMTETPVALWAKNHNTECLKPEKITPEFIEEFKKYDVDLSIVIAYGKIMPEDAINLPKLGTINIHYSLLPKYRGASPVEEALLNGDEITGVSIQQMAYQLDSGPLIASLEVPIEKNETKTELLKRLTEIGAKLLRDKLPGILEGKINLSAQDESKATFCKKLKKEDGLLDLDSDAITNFNKYRAFQDWPGTYFFKNSKRIKIKKAKYEEDLFK